MDYFTNDQLITGSLLIGTFLTFLASLAQVLIVHTKMMWREPAGGAVVMLVVLIITHISFIYILAPRIFS